MSGDQFKKLLSIGWPIDSPRMVIPWTCRWQDLLTLPDVETQQWKRWKDGKEQSYCAISIKKVSIDCLPAITSCAIGPVTVPTEQPLKKIDCHFGTLEDRDALEKQLTALFGPATLTSGTLDDKGGPVEYHNKVWLHISDRVNVEFVLGTSLEVRVNQKSA